MISGLAYRKYTSLNKIVASLNIYSYALTKSYERWPAAPIKGTRHLKKFIILEYTYP
jgi:hypothetical protein